MGTWTTVDLEDTLNVGYTIIRLYEVYHFEERAKYDRDVEDSGLFTEYVNMFLKGKQEASGWPSSDMTRAEQDTYVSEYEEVEGVVLDYCIKYNSGKRATNKLLLNSFWGKFGESNNHRIHKLVGSGVDLFKIF